MTNELLTKYARLLEEIRKPDRRKRMTEYLLDITPDDLERKLADYVSRLENKYDSKSEDEFLTFIEDFERRGTILPTISREEICDIVRKNRRKLMGYEGS